MGEVNLVQKCTVNGKYKVSCKVLTQVRHTAQSILSMVQGAGVCGIMQEQVHTFNPVAIQRAGQMELSKDNKQQVESK